MGQSTRGRQPCYNKLRSHQSILKLKPLLIRSQKQARPTTEEQGRLRIVHKMRLSGAIFVSTLLLAAEANPQGINFGESSSKKEEIANRNYGQQQSSPQIQQQQRCCIPQQQQCLQNQPLTQGDDLVGEVCIPI